MAKFRSIKNSLLGGEISPTAFGRTDLPQYAHACKTLRNMIPMTSGGAYRRPGTIFGSRLSGSTYLAPLVVPFPMSNGDKYIMELTHKINRGFYYQVWKLSNTAPNTTTLTSPAGGDDTGYFPELKDSVSFVDADVSVANNTLTVTGWTHADGTKVKFTTDGALPTGLSANTIYYTVNTSGTTFKVSLTSGGSAVDITGLSGSDPHYCNVVYDFLSPALASNSILGDEWHELQMCQVADTIFMAHKSMLPVAFYKYVSGAYDQFNPAPLYSGSSSGIEDPKWFIREAMPFQAAQTANGAVSGATITPSATTGRVTLTASASLFTANQVGSYFKLRHGASTYSLVLVTAYTNSTTVSAVVVDRLGSIPTTASATTMWWESAWSPIRGYPRTVGFYQGRVVYGGTDAFPDTMWFSGTNDYFTMSVDGDLDPSVPAVNSSPFTLTFASQQINKLSWMSSGETLIVGTESAEFFVGVERSQDSTNGFGGLNASATKQSDYGSPLQTIVRSGDELLFSSGGGGELRALVFNDSENAYVGEPTQTLYNEIPARFFTGYRNLGNRFRSAAWDSSRKIFWCVDLSGKLYSLTRDRRLGVNVWASHEMGGYDSSVTQSGVSVSSSTTTDTAHWVPTGSVISVGVMRNPTSSFHDVWLVVKRKINNAWEYHLERITGGPPSSDIAQRLIDDEFYLDSTIYKASTGGAATYTWTGFDHLEGKTVYGVASSANGLFTCSATAVVTGGSLTLATPYPPNYATINYMISFGLPFDSIVEPVRLEAGSVIGTSQGAIKRSHKAIVRFYKTLSAKVGRDASNLETLIFREGSTPLNESPDYFTGDKIVLLDSDYDRDGMIYILQDQPLPFSIVSIVMEGMTYD